MHSTPLFVAGGIAWTLGVTLVATAADTDPVGSGYDDLNRAFSAGLALVAAGALTVARRRRSAAARVLAAGALGMLAGNVLEFWGALVAGQPPEATAERLGEAEAFAGSAPGFALFALGSLLLAAGTVTLAVTGRELSRGTRVLIGAAGPLALASTALWAVTPAAAAIAGGAFAAGWLRLGQARARPAAAS